MIVVLVMGFPPFHSIVFNWLNKYLVKYLTSEVTVVRVNLYFVSTSSQPESADFCNTAISLWLDSFSTSTLAGSGSLTLTALLNVHWKLGMRSIISETFSKSEVSKGYNSFASLSFSSVMGVIYNKYINIEHYIVLY